MSQYDYDYFVIGAGSGGVRSARIAASHGAKVGIAEGQHLGGTCVNLGCVPKKLFSYAADYSAHFEDSRNFGWTGGTAPRFDWPTLLRNKNAEIQRLNKIYETLLNNVEADLLWGYAGFVDEHTLKIGDKTITAGRILIATGGHPRPLSIPGAEHAISSDQAFYLEDLPDHITIIGGGYIAVEFAHIFHGLGKEVTLVYRGDMVLRGFENEIAEALADEMIKQGIKILFNTTPRSIEKTKKGYRLTTESGNDIETDLVMAAIGRDANTGRLNLEAAGVQTGADGKTIPVDKNFATNVAHIYALGDIVNEYNLTPVAIAEGHFLADMLFGGPEHKGRVFSYDTIATAIFSGPPIGTVGMSEAEAREAGLEITVFKSGFKPLKHTISGRDERTLIKVIVETRSDRVLGIHMMGADAPEILQGFAVAMNMGLTKAAMDRTIGIHPTAAEELVSLRTPA